MKNDDKPYGIECNWDSEYLCKKCGGLLYYDIETKETLCFNSLCKNYPTGIDIFSTEEADLTFLNQQLTEIENNLGQIVKTCDYNILAWFLLERRRRIVERFFSSRIMRIDAFLLSNEILFFIKKYKSLGIRRDPLTFKTIIELYRHYSEHLELLEDLKEGRYLLARNPKNKIFRLKYFDIIVGEIWASYGLVNLQSTYVDEFRYHEVIQNIIKAQGSHISTDYAIYFERLWPFAESFQYLVKRNYTTSLKYQYSVTPTDLANILSMIISMRDNKLIVIPSMNLLHHFRIQPVRGKTIKEFIDMLSGNNDKIPILFEIDGRIILDRLTLLMFIILMHSQHLSSYFEISGQEKMSQLKKEAGIGFEKYLKDKLEKAGYVCLPTSTKICDRDYDVLCFSETNQEILIIEAKFKDPSPSSFSAHKLIEQEFVYDKRGLLPQVIRHQERYDLLFQKPEIFRAKMGLRNKLQDYQVKAYYISKFTPLISKYGNIRIMSEKEFIDKELMPKS